MNGSNGGPLGMLLVIAPLVAIPALAVFGIPNLVPPLAQRVSAETEPDVASVDDPAGDLKDAPTATSTTQPSADDLLAPMPSDRRSAAPRTSSTGDAFANGRGPTPLSPHSEPSPPPGAFDGWEIARDTGGEGSRARTERSGEVRTAADRSTRNDSIPERFAPNRTIPDEEAGTPAPRTGETGTTNNTVADIVGFTDPLTRGGRAPAPRAASGNPSAPASTPANRPGTASPGFDDYQPRDSRGTSAPKPKSGAPSGVTARGQGGDGDSDLGGLARGRDAVADPLVKPAGGASSGHSAPRTGQSGLTWPAARDHLNRLGIRKFRFESIGTDRFYFTCAVPSPTNNKVTRRFEAEAVEPMLAIELVFEQIDEWLASRGEEATE